MTLVRIVADDLTGALDAAAPLVGVAGPLPVTWDDGAAAAGARQPGAGQRIARP